MRLKKMSSDAKSYNIKLVEEQKPDLLSNSSKNGNQSAAKAELHFKRFDRIDEPFVLDVQSHQPMS